MKKLTRIGVYGVVVDHLSSILLVTKDGCCYHGKLDLPGGGIEFGESPSEALRREFLEEVGMSFDEMLLLDNLSHVEEIDCDSSPLSFHQLGQIYSIKGIKPHPQVSSTDEFGWYPIHSLTQDRLTPFANMIIKKLQENQN